MSKYGAEIELCDNNGAVSGELKVKSDELAWTESIVLKPVEECKVKITVKSGVAQLNSVIDF